MTAHQFAHKLLEGPDLPIFAPAVIEYDDAEDSFREPVIYKYSAQIHDSDEFQDVFAITYSESA